MEPARGIGQVVDVDGVSYKLSKGYAVFVKVSSSSQRQPCTWKKEWSWAEFRERVATIQHGAHQADTSSDQLGASDSGHQEATAGVPSHDVPSAADDCLATNGSQEVIERAFLASRARRVRGCAQFPPDPMRSRSLKAR